MKGEKKDEDFGKSYYNVVTFDCFEIKLAKFFSLEKKNPHLKVTVKKKNGRILFLIVEETK